jgi:Dipeptidyl aminopeptidases/acylaminoacyl-peptidases
MRPMRPDDILKIRFVSDPRISPDGRRVAFVLTTLSQERDEYLANIWMVDTTDGAPPRRFTTGPGRDTAPRWSPDGARLAFVSERERGKKGQLMVMPVEGGEAVALTQLRNGVAAPAWSPDGTRLAFVSRVGGWQEPESEEERKKSRPARVISTLKYRFNGEGFIHDRPTHVFVVSAAGGAPLQLTAGDCPDLDPVWSPDGRSIAFVSARHEDRDYDDATDVWMVPDAGGAPRRVTDTIGPAMHPAFSPDGKHLAYLGRRHRNEFGRNVRVFTVSVEGGAPRSLTDALDRSCAPLDLAPIWSADGTWLTFAAEDAGAQSVYRVRSNGGGAAPERVIGGERGVTGVSAATDGTLAFAITDPVTPAEVGTCAADGSGERRLTDVNQAWRAEVALARPERFRFERAGLTVDGWIMKPVGWAADARYPGLLNIHGGPHAQYGWGFFDEFQVQAGAGYAVVYTNPRGSQGYGEAFTRAVVGDWGGGDFADVMAGLDEALRRAPWIDPERLGVLGGSYGGFLTSWTVGHTDRFRAACSERAVNYHPSMFGTSDIGHLFNEVEIGGLPWEMPEVYAERSPLTHAKNIHTPLLIIHSEDDLRCPIEQGEQLFVALKKQRKEAVFVRFSDENHELSRSGKPRHRLERFRIILDWFTGRLAPEPARGR